ncbi:MULTISPECIES: hypothetical protein [Pseudomonas]|uniref:hypothetical protein n=1 Tax=Pseudomonas TaxID=286 RepID=UPI0005798F44|nr:MULTISPECIES: hypothetical protein [Pseudomonas putida group]MCL8300878.1 hypothetical protein [Pseudomonas mosselii]MCL8341226.1 hypothetical protein [Pseudomonas mosselii]WJR28451.1 hypothetical protein LU678_029680 [Pseudomonas mosselii]
MSNSPEKQAAIARLLELEQAFAAAQKELDAWREYDFRRTDGSTRQDNMHDEEGRACKDAAWHAQNAVDAQQRLIASMV